MRKTVRRTVLRLISAWLMLCLAACAAVAAVSAAGGDNALMSDDKGIISTTSEEADWNLSDDEKTLTGCGQTFTQYNFPVGSGMLPHSVYYFTEENLYIAVNTQGELGAATFNDNLYVTDALRTELDTLTTSAARYCLGTGYRDGREYDGTVMEAEFDLSCLDTEHGEKTEPDVTQLSAADEYTVMAYDSTYTVYAAVGTLYRLDGAWYYADHATLGNDRFDADGWISLRRGTVPCVRLNDIAAQNVSSLVDNMEPVYTQTELEGMTEYVSDEMRLMLTVMFWVGFAFIGFALPVAALVLGFVFAGREKWGRPRRWYLLSVLAGVWILLSVILLLLLVL